MRALITGGTGFVGRYLQKHLQDDWGMTVCTTGREGKEKDGCYQMELLEPERIREVLLSVKPDFIFHLAAQSSVARSWQDPGQTVDVNIKGTLHLLDAARALPVTPKVLLIGSGEEYGAVKPDEIPVKESTAICPANIYAATKAAQNMIGRIYAEAYHMHIVMVRAFNHIGPGQAPAFVVSDFCRRVAIIEKGLSEPTLWVGNLNAKRDFTDVRDVVRAYALLLEKGKSGHTYNVGSGRAVSIREVLDFILHQSKAEITVCTDAARIRPVDVPVIEADISAVRRDTGWQPEIGLEKTLLETLEYWRRNV